MNHILNGAMVSGAMIMAIGAQNAFVLKHGLQKKHVFYVVSICFICDFLLMTIGVLGLGNTISTNIGASLILALLGAVFLGGYGIKSYLSSWKGNSSLSIDSDQNGNSSIKKSVISTLGITLLNPHVYLDTVVVIGGIAGTLSFASKLEFLTGAIISSAIWFISLGYGARLLIPLFKKRNTWRYFDFFVGSLMFYISYKLILYIIQNWPNNFGFFQ